MEVSEDFKKMIDEDIENLKDALADASNTVTLEYAKLQLYKELTAKYHPYLPKFSDGLYSYYSENSLYDDVEGDSLRHNLNQVCYKLKAFKATGYLSLIPISGKRNSAIVLNNNYTNHNINDNYNENNNSIYATFGQVRQYIENMLSLTEPEIEEILHKVNEIEQIVKSSDRKSKKWENAKGIIKWIADKGVDVGISLLPLLLQIK